MFLFPMDIVEMRDRVLPIIAGSLNFGAVCT